MMHWTISARGSPEFERLHFTGKRVPSAVKHCRSLFAEAATNDFRVIPTTGAKHLEPCINKPLFGGRPSKSHKCSLALRTPCVRARSVRIIAPKETDALPSIDREGNVFADKTDALTTMLPARDETLCFTHTTNKILISFAIL
jgi:hypothetical protein